MFTWVAHTYLGNLLVMDNYFQSCTFPSSDFLYLQSDVSSVLCLSLEGTLGHSLYTVSLWLIVSW